MAKFRSKPNDEKKKEIEKLTEDRNEQVEKFFKTPEQMKEYLDFMSKFYNYSPRNSALIQKQFRGAEAVGSFTFWKNKGYSVQKGEKGIKILVPTKYETFEREREGKKYQVGVKYASKEEKEAIKKGYMKTKDHIGYAAGYVFDISQTNAKAEDLPRIFPNRWIDGKVENYDEMFRSLKELGRKMDVEILDKPFQELGAAKGSYVEYQALNSRGEMENRKAIELNPRNSELHNVKTVIHELAHAKLHGTESGNHDRTHPEKEFQAEMTAYTVCSHFNLDTTDYSLHYLHHYTEDHTQINDKIALLEEVKDTSYEFITHLENDLVKTNELQKEKESDQELQQKFGNIEIIFRDEVKRVSDLTPDEFQSTFYDKHDRNVLNYEEFQGLDQQKAIEAFNNLNDKWNVQMDNVKMIHPDMKEPQAYVVWSETNIDHRLMNIKDIDMTLAKANIDSFKTPGYDKTRVNFVVPDENGIHVKSADRIDLGDGMYNNLHDHLKNVQPSLAKYVPQTNDHLKDIYSKEVISTTVESIYKENLYLKHANVKNELAIDVSDSDVQVIEHYAVHHNYLSKSELDSLKSNIYETFTNDKEQMDTTNIMVHLKGHYEKYQSHLQAENKGELTEEKVVNRMKAENQYTDVKYLALKSNVVDERMIDRMESSMKDRMTNSSTKNEAKEKDSPFQKSPIQQKNIGLSM